MCNQLKKYIQEGWGLARKTYGERDLELPHPFVPPSIKGEFRTLYYWDTYFTNIGLILDGYIDWARENLDDLLYSLDFFGCVPNYTRKDGADFCSQPPLLFLMIQDIYEQTQDNVWLTKAVESLEKEYSFWMTERMTAIGLNQYGTNTKDKNKLIEYYEYVSTRVELSKDIPENEKVIIAKNFIAEAESGEDFTPRYDNHNALEYVQIDLNSHLYGMEDFLCSYFVDRDKEKYAYYTKQKTRRLELIEKYCFNEKAGVYCDYNFVENKKNEIVCCACFLPYFYRFARKDCNILAVYKLLKCKGGVVSCQDTGIYTYQWGYPNIWAPHQYFAFVALKNYGFDKEANKLRDNYIALLEKEYNRTGKIWERYDEDGVAKSLEYETQPMLGWTAGVYHFFFADRNKK